MFGVGDECRATIKVRKPDNLDEKLLRFWHRRRAKPDLMRQQHNDQPERP
jgi:hypothetical protein